MNEKETSTVIGAGSAIFLLGWLVMLALGGLHSQWTDVPALGYWVSVAAVFVMELVVWAFRRIIHG